MMKFRIISLAVSLTLVGTLLVMAQAPPAPAQQPAPPAAPPQPAAPPTPAPQVSAADLSLQNAALSEVVDRLARQLHYVLVPPPGGCFIIRVFALK